MLRGLAAVVPFLGRFLAEEDQEEEEDAVPLAPARVAVVGAGVGGCCAAYFLREKAGEAVKIDVFERGVVGGRTATFAFRGHVYETGASIIHKSNKYLVDLSEKFGESLCQIFPHMSLPPPPLSLPRRVRVKERYLRRPLRTL